MMGRCHQTPCSCLVQTFTGPRALSLNWKCDPLDTLASILLSRSCGISVKHYRQNYTLFTPVREGGAEYWNTLFSHLSQEKTSDVTPTGLLLYFSKCWHFYIFLKYSLSRQAEDDGHHWAVEKTARVTSKGRTLEDQEVQMIHMLTGLHHSSRRWRRAPSCTCSSSRCRSWQ